MRLGDLQLIHADPGQHFGTIAALISRQETEPSTQQTLTDWYDRHLVDGISCTVAVDAADHVLGFYCIYRDNLNVERQYGLYLIVDPLFRCQGLGNQLYKDLLIRSDDYRARILRSRVRETCAEGVQFASRRGFVVKKRSVEMLFNLKAWDETRYQPVLDSLHKQGFQFTSMADLGDTQEARRKLFALNNDAAATDPGSDGIPPWASFEEFERDVCNTYWYHPDGQIIAIDTSTGDWAAMSAITVFQGADHAYNLFTGTDIRYRGRKLAQAVKSLALCKAREFGVDTVRTSHNSENSAMIAVDTKLGYVHVPGVLLMVRELENG